MAHRIQAIRTYRSRIQLGEATRSERFMELITQRTTLSRGVVKNVQESEVETLIGLLLDGKPVHTGIAIYTPDLDLEGNFTVSVRIDKRIVQALNVEGAFRGRIAQAENRGKSGAELVVLWDAAHPDDPVE